MKFIKKLVISLMFIMTLTFIFFVNIKGIIKVFTAPELSVDSYNVIIYDTDGKTELYNYSIEQSGIYKLWFSTYEVDSYNFNYCSRFTLGSYVNLAFEHIFPESIKGCKLLVKSVDGEVLNYIETEQPDLPINKYIDFQDFVFSNRIGYKSLDIDISVVGLGSNNCNLCIYLIDDNGICDVCNGKGKEFCNNVSNYKGRRVYTDYIDYGQRYYNVTCSYCGAEHNIFPSKEDLDADYYDCFRSNYYSVFNSIYYNYYDGIYNGKSSDDLIKQGYSPYYCEALTDVVCSDCDGICLTEVKHTISFYDTNEIVDEGVPTEYTYEEFIAVYEKLKNQNAFIGLFMQIDGKNENIISYINKVGWEYIKIDTLELYCYYKNFSISYYFNNYFEIFQIFTDKNNDAITKFDNLINEYEFGKTYSNSLEDDYGNFHYLFEVYGIKTITSSNYDKFNQLLYVVAIDESGYIVIYDFYQNKTFYKNLNFAYDSNIYVMESCDILESFAPNGIVATDEDLIRIKVSTVCAFYVFSYLDFNVLDGMFNDFLIFGSPVGLDFVGMNIDKMLNVSKYASGYYIIDKYVNVKYCYLSNNEIVEKNLEINELGFIFHTSCYYQSNLLFMLNKSNNYVDVIETYLDNKVDNKLFHRMKNYQDGIVDDDNDTLPFEIVDGYYVVYNFDSLEAKRKIDNPCNDCNTTGYSVCKSQSFKLLTPFQADVLDSTTDAECLECGAVIALPYENAGYYDALQEDNSNSEDLIAEGFSPYTCNTQIIEFCGCKEHSYVYGYIDENSNGELDVSYFTLTCNDCGNIVRVSELSLLPTYDEFIHDSYLFNYYNMLYRNCTLEELVASGYTPYSCENEAPVTCTTCDGLGYLEITAEVQQYSIVWRYADGGGNAFHSSVADSTTGFVMWKHFPTIGSAPTGYKYYYMVNNVRYETMTDFQNLEITENISVIVYKEKLIYKLTVVDNLGLLDNVEFEVEFEAETYDYMKEFSNSTTEYYDTSLYNLKGIYIDSIYSVIWSEYHTMPANDITLYLELSKQTVSVFVSLVTSKSDIGTTIEIQELILDKSVQYTADELLAMIDTEGFCDFMNYNLEQLTFINFFEMIDDGLNQETLGKDTVSSLKFDDNSSIYVYWKVSDYYTLNIEARLYGKTKATIEVSKLSGYTYATAELKDLYNNALKDLFIDEHVGYNYNSIKLTDVVNINNNMTFNSLLMNSNKFIAFNYEYLGDYEILFKSNNSLFKFDSVFAKYGEEVELPTFEQRGYLLEGWYLDSDFTNKITTNYIEVDFDEIVYAKIVENKVNVEINVVDSNESYQENGLITYNVELDYGYQYSTSEIFDLLNIDEILINFNCNLEQLKFDNIYYMPGGDAIVIPPDSSCEICNLLFKEDTNIFIYYEIIPYNTLTVYTNINGGSNILLETVTKLQGYTFARQEIYSIYNDLARDEFVKIDSRYIDDNIDFINMQYLSNAYLEVVDSLTLSRDESICLSYEYVGNYIVSFVSNIEGIEFSPIEAKFFEEIDLPKINKAGYLIVGYYYDNDYIDNVALNDNKYIVDCDSTVYIKLLKFRDELEIIKNIKSVLTINEITQLYSSILIPEVICTVNTDNYTGKGNLTGEYEITYNIIYANDESLEVINVDTLKVKVLGGLSMDYMYNNIIVIPNNISYTKEVLTNDLITCGKLPQEEINAIITSNYYTETNLTLGIYDLSLQYNSSSGLEGTQDYKLRVVKAPVYDVVEKEQTSTIDTIIEIVVIIGIAYIAIVLLKKMFKRGR